MKIKPIKALFSKDLCQLKITANIFDIEDKNCTITWIFLDDAGAEVKSGNYTLTEAEYDNWGSENNYLFSVFVRYFENAFGEKVESAEKKNIIEEI